jgi:hypothetical protein
VTLAQIDAKDPSTCEPCHATVVSEWRESLHAHAHHDRDPIYAGVRTLRMKREGEAVAASCAGCHHPGDVERFDSAAAQVGVGCATCHQADAVRKLHGIAEFEGAANAMLGPHDLPSGRSPVHGTGNAPAHMKDGATLCLSCHGELSTAKGLPQCTTGPEWRRVEPYVETCVGCHMETVQAPSGSASTRQTHRSHHFAGPVRAWLHGDDTVLRKSVKLSAVLEGAELSVILENGGGHSFPSGFPARTAVVRAIGFAESGAEVWKSASNDPMEESPQAVLTKVYVDAAGEPTLAPFAEKLARDSRLDPAETKIVTFEVPPEVTRAEVELLFFLMPQRLAKVLKLEEHPLASPKVIARKAVTRVQ